MLEKLSTLTLGRYRPSLLIWLLVLLVGAFSYTTLLDREGFPPVEVPFAVTSGTYFVDDAETVDETVVDTLSQQVSSLDEVVRVQSTARPNSFTIVSEFSGETTSRAGAEQIQDSLQKLDEALPSSVSYSVDPISATQFNNEYDLLVSVFAPDAEDLPSLYDLEQSAAALAIELEQDANVQRAEVESQFVEVQIEESGQTQQRQTRFSWYGEAHDGQFVAYESVVVGVIAADGADEIELDETVSDMTNAWDDDGVEARISASFADGIRTQIASLQENVITGLIAVLVVVGFIISWRAALVIALFIPTVLSATLIGIYLSGNTLNTIVLFALVLVLGLIVDNAIVVTEALEAGRGSRSRRDKHVREAISRVGLAVAAGTLTTVLVFGPILFVSGILGDFIRILPTTVITALLLSLVVSIVYIPFFASSLLGQKSHRSKLRQSILHSIENFCLFLPRKLTVTKSLRRRAGIGISMVLVSLVGIGYGLFLLSQLPFNIFPPSDDSDSLRIDASFDSSVTIDEAQELTATMNQTIGGVLSEDIRRISYPQASDRGATAQIELAPFTERSTSSRSYVEQLDTALSEVPNADVSVRQVDAGPPPESFPFALQVYGEDAQNSLAFAREVSTFLREEPVSRPDGSIVPIEEVRITDDLSVIRRDEGRRYIEISARFQAEDVSGALAATKTAIEQQYDDQALPSFDLSSDDITFDFGQESENEESFASAQFAFLLAVGLMYLLLVLQFNSFSQPLLILLAVPFGLLGVSIGLHIYDHALSFFVLIGLIGLVGIVVNNAILLTDFANQQRRKGLAADKAITTSLQQRLRPIITTTLTTIGALSPLALSDPFWEPLAITIIFGLLSSTLLVIFCFPYYYLAIEFVRDKKNKRWPALK